MLDHKIVHLMIIIAIYVLIWLVMHGRVCNDFGSGDDFIKIIFP